MSDQPHKQKSSDDHSSLLDFACWTFVVGRAGFEPATNGLKVPVAVAIARSSVLTLLLSRQGLGARWILLADPRPSYLRPASHEFISTEIKYTLLQIILAIFIIRYYNNSMRLTFDRAKRAKTLLERGLDFGPRRIISMRKANERKIAKFAQGLD